jgi:hypothetical protein
MTDEAVAHQEDDAEDAMELAAGGAPGAGGPPPQALELEERGKRQATVAMVLDLILVVIVFLMVMKPGV